jgi:hypothetical protein
MMPEKPNRIGDFISVVTAPLTWGRAFSPA